MADRLAVPYLKQYDYLAFDRLQLEVAGSQLTDRVLVWTQPRNLAGFGYGASGATGFGFAAGQPFGSGRFGGGWFGQGVEVATPKTAARYVAADISVRARAVDKLGNVGAWSAAEDIAHRPAPPAPTAPTLAGNVLSWTWADP